MSARKPVGERAIQRGWGSRGTGCPGARLPRPVKSPWGYPNCNTLQREDITRCSTVGIDKRVAPCRRFADALAVSFSAQASSWPN